MSENHEGTRLLSNRRARTWDLNGETYGSAGGASPDCASRATTSCTSWRAISTKAFSRYEGAYRATHLKQVAQELIRRLDGVEEVNNRLVVVASPCPP